MEFPSGLRVTSPTPNRPVHEDIRVSDCAVPGTVRWGDGAACSPSRPPDGTAFLADYGMAAPSGGRPLEFELPENARMFSFEFHQVTGVDVAILLTGYDADGVVVGRSETAAEGRGFWHGERATLIVEPGAAALRRVEVRRYNAPRDGEALGPLGMDLIRWFPVVGDAGP